MIVTGININIDGLARCIGVPNIYQILLLSKVIVIKNKNWDTVQISDFYESSD